MNRTTFFNEAQVRNLLDSGLAEMQLTCSETECQQLIDYLALMIKWNPIYNLTSIRDLDKMVSHHLLDSLAITKIYREWVSGFKTNTVLDVGSGGGLPGIILAITNPTWQITLIDPVHKKTAFLTQVKAQLSLNNTTIITGKVESLPKNHYYDLITSRAFASIIDFISLSQNVLREKGVFAAMKGVYPNEELAELEKSLPATWLNEVHRLKVPQLNAERHVIKLWRTNQAPSQQQKPNQPFRLNNI